MASLLRKCGGRRVKKKTKQKTDVSKKKNGAKDDSSYTFRISQASSFALRGDDIVIVASKESKKRMSGLELEKQDNCLVVKRILSGSPFSRTDLAPDMEIRIINGIDCSKLKDINEAYGIMKEAQNAVTIVAREKFVVEDEERGDHNNISLQEQQVEEETDDIPLKESVEERDIPLDPLQPPSLSPPREPKKKWSSPGTAHVWLQMVDHHVHHRKADSTPSPSQYHLSSPPSAPKKEYFLRKEEQVQGEDIEAPPAPVFKKTSRPKTLPSNLEVLENKTSHSTMSEITLNPSQHPPSLNLPDIVVMLPNNTDVASSIQTSLDNKTNSVQSVLASLYPDFGGDDEVEDEDIISDIIEKSSIAQSHIFQDVSLSSLLRDEEEEEEEIYPPPSHLLGIDVPQLAIDEDDDDNDRSVGSFRGAGPMESPSLYAPSIPRVGASDHFGVEFL